MTLEPGEPIEVTYGNNRTINAAALSLRGKRELLLCVEVINDNSEKMSDRFAAMERAVKICCPGITEEALETIDDRASMRIVTDVMKAGVLSEGEAKKSG